MTKPTFLAVLLTAYLTLGPILAIACDDEPDAIDENSDPWKQDIALNEHLYVIQHETSKMQFRVDSPVGEVWASFKDFKGGFALLDKGVYSEPAIVDVNTESLDTEGAFIGMLLRGESFFDVENFPRMRFVGSSFEWFSDTQAVLKGQMTIQNVTRPIAFYVDLVNPNAENKYSERITMKATTTIKRSEFGLYTLLPVVSDKVNLYMSVDAVKRDTSTI